jgi:hypothetical protein
MSANMSENWSPQALLDAVRARLRRGLDDGDERQTDASLVDGDILVTFHWRREVERFAMRFPATEAPAGPSTGEVCSHASEWATEVGWVLEEELGTGLVRRAPRSAMADGVIELLWRSTAD